MGGCSFVSGRPPTHISALVARVPVRVDGIQRTYRSISSHGRRRRIPVIMHRMLRGHICGPRMDRADYSTRALSPPPFRCLHPPEPARSARSRLEPEPGESRQDRWRRSCTRSDTVSEPIFTDSNWFRDYSQVLARLDTQKPHTFVRAGVLQRATLASGAYAIAPRSGSI